MHLGNSARPAQMMLQLSPSHALITLYVIISITLSFYNTVLWAFVDELELREKLESHQPPSRDFKQEFIDKLIVQ